MKRFLAIALLASALMVSCADDFKYKGEEVGFGTLSFADLQISVDQDEVVVRKSTPDQIGAYYKALRAAHDAAGDQEVAGISIRNVYDLIFFSLTFYVTKQNYLHNITP